MRRIDRLKQEARNAANWRGHTLSKFSHDDGYGRNPNTAISICQECGATIVVRTNPAPNQIDISGAAVATNCKEKN